MSQLVVYTAHRSYAGRDRLDITIQQQDPEGRLFAPERTAFREYSALKQAGLLTLEAWDAYETKYRAHMEKVAAEHWERLFSREIVTLVCFCQEASFCHRRLLAEMLVARGGVYRGERRIVRRGDAAE
jgi:hypothetical protein